MTDDDRIPVGAILLWVIAWIAFLIVVVSASDDAPDPCSIDAPMEQAQCRTGDGRHAWKWEVMK